MSRQCTVCTNPKRKAIDKALLQGESNRRIAAQFELAATSIRRHKGEHLPLSLVTAERAQQQEAQQIHALDLLQQIARQVERVGLLSDATDHWLRDPEDPSRYSIDPRPEDISVVYHSPGDDGKPIRRKRRLSEIIGEIEGTGLTVDHVETKHADPRELLLKAADGMKGHMALLVSVLETLYNAQEMEAFQAAFLRAIGEVAPDVKNAIIDTLRERQPVGPLTRPGLRESER